MISIIIPVLNEADGIEALLTHLLECSDTDRISEIILVDGGSTDNTLEIIKTFCLSNTTRKLQTNLNCALPDITLLTSDKGRAKQMNHGAMHANGDILYFLHADSFPPKHFDQLIIDEVYKGNKAGCFRLQFDSNHWWLQLASWFTQFSWRISRGGDQSQFITRTLFDAIGGYDESYIIYEDNILINKLYANNQFVVINKKIKTSARRYHKQGIWKLQYHYWRIYIKKWFGASADDLFTYYKKHVN